MYVQSGLRKWGPFCPAICAKCFTEDGFKAEVSYPLPGDTVTTAQVTLKAVDGAYRISAFQPEG